MTTSLEGWPDKAKEAPSAHEVRLAPLDTNANLNIATMREGSTKIVGMLSQRNVDASSVQETRWKGESA